MRKRAGQNGHFLEKKFRPSPALGTDYGNWDLIPFELPDLVLRAKTAYSIALRKW
jgi:hypothetical protein